MPVKALMMVMAMLAFMSAAIATEENEPDAELLEFLADWEGGDGQWLEPSSFAQMNGEGDRYANTRMQPEQEEDDEH